MNIAMRTRIKRMREEKGISQSQMANLLHMDERNYKRIESGEKKAMDLDLLKRIAEVLEADAMDIINADTVQIENITENTISQSSNCAEAIVNLGEMNVTNNNTAETLSLMEEMVRIIEANRKTMEDNSKLIALLLEQKIKE